MPVLLGLLLSLAFPLTLSSTVYNVTIQSSGCTFYYTNSSSFQFLNCSLQQTTSSNWDTCLTNCCSQVQQERPSLVALERCRLSGSDLTLKFVVVLLIVLVCAFGVVVVICLCMVVIRVIRSHLRKNKIVPEVAITAVQWQDETDLTREVNHFQWSSRARKGERLPEAGPCAICLQENTTACLFCGHQYHPVCIGSWLQKNNCCPCCRLAHLKGVKVYCSACRWRYLVCTTTLMSREGENIPVRCNDCGAEEGWEEGKRGAESSLGGLGLQSMEELGVEQEQAGVVDNSLIFEELSP